MFILLIVGCGSLISQGTCSVKSGDQTSIAAAALPIVSSLVPMHVWSVLGTLCVPPKVLNFMQRAVLGVIHTQVALQSKGEDFSLVCPICVKGPETLCHALVQCTFGKDCWTPIGVWLWDSWDNIGNQFGFVFQQFALENLGKTLMQVWSLWKNRNAIVWLGKNSSLPHVIQLAK